MDMPSIADGVPSDQRTNIGAAVACSIGWGRIVSIAHGPEDQDRRLRLQLQRVARNLLSTQTAGPEDALILRRATVNGGDQLHFSSHASARDARALGAADSSAFPLRAQ